jgi:UDP-glucose 4-epimerase
VRTLVTGGAGFIGSHLVDALVARGDEVLAIDDLSTGKEANLADALAAGATLERADVTDGERLVGLFERFRPEAVFHLAAQIDVRKSMADPGFDVRLNVLGTVNALEAASRAGASRFVFTSTGGAIYGEGDERPDEVPFAETARCEPDSVYGQSKLAAEGYVALYRRIRGLAAATVRLGNVYGPRQDAATEAGVVAIFFELARDDGKPTVYGTGKQTRDYIYVSDVVSGLLACEASTEPGPINLGTGVETDVLQLVERIGPLFGRADFEPQFAPPRAGEIERTALDTSLAERVLGFKAECTVDQGLQGTFTAEA